MLKELKPAFLMMVVMTVLTGFIYPGVVTVLAQLLFHDQASGSLITVNGTVVGSRLIGQNFTKPEYFHPRPSAAGSGYDPTASGGSNLGPTSAKLIATIKQRVAQYCLENGIPLDPKTGASTVPLPADAVTASASGLDPHISPANAELQAPRVAKARGVSVDQLREMVAHHTEGRTLGLLGEPRVNVLELNLALDSSFPKK